MTLSLGSFLNKARIPHKNIHPLCPDEIGLIQSAALAPNQAQSNHKSILQYTKHIAGILRTRWDPPQNSAAPAPPLNHDTNLPVPQNLSIFGHVFPQASKPVRIRLKSRNRFQDFIPGNSLAVKSKRRTLCVPSRTRPISGVTNHHIQITVGMVKKL